MNNLMLEKEDIERQLSYVLFGYYDFSEGPDNNQASATCPEKGERTQKTGETTALLLSISPFLEVIISFMARSQMKFGMLLLVVSDHASVLEQSFAARDFQSFSAAFNYP